MLTNCNLLLQGLKDGVIMLDVDGYIKYANPAVTEIAGFSPDELLNESIGILYPDGGDPVKVEYELGLTKKKGKWISEGWKVKKDSSRFWCEMTLAPLYSENNQTFEGYSCLLRNTSEKKQHEVALRESEERYRLMVDAVRDYAIFLMDPGGHIMTWNEGAKRTKGYSAAEIIGKHFSIFYTAEDLADGKPARELKIATATGKYEEEGWRIKKDGSVFWANIVITALFNDQNKLIGFSKVTRNLTDRKENEENLRQSEERYRALVEQVLDYGIFMMDEKGRIVSWNEGAHRMNGYTAEEIRGKYFSIFYPEEDILNGKPAYELKIARTEGVYEEEGWRIKKDGSRFWASVVITAIYNHQGIHIGFSKVTRDLTERKEAERALRESYEKYRKLANELQITNTQLSYANHELEQFTSIVSHDLQEPVRTIKSFLQLIELKLDKGESADLNNYINKAISSANRMKELIKNLLQYAQLSREEVVKKEVDVNELFNEALQNLKTTVDTSNARIHIDNRVDKIWGDPVQLVQLIQNLVSNAIKFSDCTTPTINIRSTIENGHVKFAVSDNGIGIQKEDLSKIFEIFKRLNTKKDYPGTGIGLAICKKIVDRHQGKIWPESQPGKGTTFYFTINDESIETVPA